MKDHEYATVKPFLKWGYDIELIPCLQVKPKHFKRMKIVKNGAGWYLLAVQIVENMIEWGSHLVGYTGAERVD